MKLVVRAEYHEKAKSLTRDEAERVLSRMRKKLMRRIQDQLTSPLDAVALQLQKEDEDLMEWRAQWAEISNRDNKRSKNN